MEQKVYCPKCNKEYANRSNLARHCANKHAWSIAKSAPIPPEQQSAKNQEDSDVEPDSESEAPGTTLDETTEAVKNLLDNINLICEDYFFASLIMFTLIMRKTG